MTDFKPLPGTSLAFLDRQRERETLDGLLREVRAGRGGVMVVRGEAGIGKSALLDYVARVAADLRLIRVAGVESEMELAFAALHQICSPDARVPAAAARAAARRARDRAGPASRVAA